jgi:hypothetical protein
MDWEKLLGFHKDAVYTNNVFCPKNYKNKRGWKQKIESVNRKFNLNLSIVSIDVMEHFEVCETHHCKIIGTYNVEGELFYDDYFCKYKKGCRRFIKNQKVSILFITKCDINIRDEIKEPNWFSWI